MLFHALVVVAVGFLSWSGLAAATWQPAFALVPVLTAWMMAACARGRERLAIPILNAALAWLVASPTDPGSLPVQDFQNHLLVNTFLQSWQPELPVWAFLAGLAVLALPDRTWRPVAPVVLALVVAVNLLQATLLNPAFFFGMAHDSGAEPVFNDNSSYRQVYHRVAAGQSYYPAYIDSFTHLRPPGEAAPRYGFGFRLPGSFMLWKYLSGRHPMVVPVLYLGLCAAAMAAVYRTGLNWLPPQQAVLAPVLLGPILTYGIPGWHFLMADYWGMLLFLISLPWFAAGRAAPVALLLSVSTTIREFMLAPAALALVAGLADRRMRPRWMLVLPLLSSALVLGTHVYLMKTAYVELTGGGMVSDYSGEGIAFVTRMLHFAAAMFGRWDLALPVVLILAAVGLFRIPRPLQILLGGHLVAFGAFALLHGTGSRVYWGIMFNPVLLILAGWALADLPRQETPKPTAQASAWVGPWGLALLALLASGCTSTGSVPQARFVSPTASPASRPSGEAPVRAPGIPAPPAPVPPRAPFTVEASSSRVTWAAFGHRGGFNRFQGRLDLVGDDPARSSFQFEVDLTSLFSNDATLTGRLLGREFFAISRFPVAAFQSTGIARRGEAFEVTGDLNLHGVTRRISFPASIRVERLRVYAGSRFGLDCRPFGLAYPGPGEGPVVLDLVLEAVPAP